MSVELDSLARLGFGSSMESSRGAKSVERVAQEFESLFIQQLLSVMRTEPDEDSLFPGGAGKEIYESMMDQALGQALAHRGGIGLSRPLIERLQQDAGTTEGVPGAVSGTPAESLERRFAQALSGYRVTSPVGWRNDPFNGEQRFHRGVDLAFEEGAQVPSLTSGTVVFSGFQAGFGNTVLVEGPGGVRVRYAHLKELAAEQGKEIAKGEQIGLAGSTGRSTGPHLHLEVEAGGQLIDPLA